MHKDWQMEFLHSGNRGATWGGQVDVADTGWSDKFVVGPDKYLPAVDAENGYVALSWVGAGGVYEEISAASGAAGTFSSATSLGAGNSAIPAGPFLLWLNSQSNTELTTFDTNFFGSSEPTAVAPVVSSEQLNLIQSAAAFSSTMSASKLVPAVRESPLAFTSLAAHGAGARFLQA